VRLDVGVPALDGLEADAAIVRPMAAVAGELALPKRTS
jgi:hypothetical protein